MGQHCLDRIAECDHRTAEGETAHVRQNADFLPPGLQHRAGRDPALFGAEQLELDGGDVGLWIQTGFRDQSATFHPRALADGHGDAGQQRRGVLGCLAHEALDGPETRRLDFPGYFAGALGRRPSRHLEIRGYEIPLDLFGEGRADDPGGKQRHRHDQHADHRRDHHGGLIRCERDGPVQRTLDKACQRLVHAGLYAGEVAVDHVARRPGRARQVGQMVRQDEKRFDERDEEHGDQHHGDGGHDFADAARQEDQRRESCYGREDREGQRHLDAACALDGGDHSRSAPAALVMDMFRNDDRVVDDNADGEHEREQRDRVERQVEGQHGRERTDARNGEPDRDPDRKAYLEEQRQREEHQGQALGAVLEQEVAALFVDLRLVVPDGDFDAVRQGATQGGVDVVGDGRRHVAHVFVVGSVHFDERGGQTLVADAQRRVGEGVPDLGDVADAQRRAVLARAYDNAFEVVLIVALPDRAYQDAGIGGFDAAGRQVQGGAPNRIRHLREREPKRAQLPSRHFDGDFVVADAAGFHQ